MCAAKEWELATKSPTSSDVAASSSAPEQSRDATTGHDRVHDRKTYVIDTSVLLSDPRAMMRFAEHEVVLPVVVITELEGKRHHPELGYFARPALRLLDDLRISTAGSTGPCRSATTAARCGSS